MQKLIIFTIALLVLTVISSIKNSFKSSSISDIKFTQKSTNIIVQSPSPTPSPIITISDYIMGQINDYRKNYNLVPFKTDSNTCGFAALRAKEISANFNHDGFTSRMNNKSLPYPSYSYLDENLANVSDYTEVVKTWIASPNHAENLRANVLYACIGNFGNYYIFEGWKP
ncbi:MAG: CAP domain-containing protein [bacterium]|nr:CAP domain-containing protein [bacterium]